MHMLLAAVAGSALTAAVPPVPVAEPFEEQRFGITIQDPYRWMEKPERAGEVRDWLVNAGQHAREELSKLPEREKFEELLNLANRAGVSYTSAQISNQRLFYLRLDPEARVSKLVVRKDGVERVVLDPATSSAALAAINNYTVSPDGGTVAVHVAEGGGEAGEVRFLDVESGREIAPRIGPVWGEFPVNWLSSRKVVYTRMADPQPGVDPILNMRMYTIGFGEKGPGIPLLGAGVPNAPAFEPREFPTFYNPASTRWAMGFGTGARADSRILVTRIDEVLAGTPKWRSIAEYADQVRSATIVGDNIYLLSSKTNSSRTLLKGSLNDPELKLRPIMEGGEVILRSISEAADGLYLFASKGGAEKLFFQPNGSEEFREVVLPFDGAISSWDVGDQGRSLLMGLTGWLRNRTHYRVSGGIIQPVNLKSASWEAGSKHSVITDEAISSDGTRVPMAILMPAEGKLPAGRPTILHGYGSYGLLNTEPTYSGNNLAWLEQGGVFAYCGTRGGGENGRAWHEAGRAANKPNAHADFIACAERLIQLGYAKPSQITAIGVSAGGQLVSPAVMKRPDLFAGMILRVAMLNPARLETAENGANQFAEAGDPRTEDGFKGLVMQDSYLMLEGAKDIPDTLLTIGLNDRRVSPWMSGKFAARAVAKFGGQRRVLVRTEAEDGHGVGSARDLKIQEMADIYAFAWNQATKAD
ncbi:S9 family peptidase [Allosphingosinicella flava]|uniref:prolyl oligopeptidase n=1 Tax=Allosphingosinicella flava TaxID=2771430 RepID=A0A7T2GKB5_9SPHN|nr:prolyl oligopeptidase family serine peptidase [Sphingosinicella flava]QPQ55444.1 S9 family peptidase [Sphingosinicella flava]